MSLDRDLTRWRLIAVYCLCFWRQSSNAEDDAIPRAAENLVANPVIYEELNKAVTAYKVPGMIAGIVEGDSLIAIAASGVRKIGSDEPITINDKMHLGSCTKAMTATRIAMVVEAGHLQWDSTLADVFPDELATIHPDFHAVTLTQLLTHRAGLPPNGPWNQLGKERSTTDQRMVLLRKIMQRAPKSKPGSKYEYSNVGYAIAGLMAEKVTGESWEKLMEEGLFQPLGMTSAGFGPPGERGGLDQPWGHLSFFSILRPAQHDNPAALGPAGTVHASVADWAKFAVLHLQAARGQPRLLTEASFTRLQRPESGQYAMGWIIPASAPAPMKGKILSHDGSNTMWYCSVWIFPEQDIAILVAANRGDAAMHEACHHVVRTLYHYYQNNSKKVAD